MTGVGTDTWASRSTDCHRAARELTEDCMSRKAVKTQLELLIKVTKARLPARQAFMANMLGNVRQLLRDLPLDRPLIEHTDEEIIALVRRMFRERSNQSSPCFPTALGLSGNLEPVSSTYRQYGTRRGRHLGSPDSEPFLKNQFYLGQAPSVRTGQIPSHASRCAGSERSNPTNIRRLLNYTSRRWPCYSVGSSTTRARI